jgi:hypothetical protein
MPELLEILNKLHILSDLVRLVLVIGESTYITELRHDKVCKTNILPASLGEGRFCFITLTSVKY